MPRKTQCFGILTLALLAAASQAQPPAHDNRTGAGFENTSVPWQQGSEGAALNGACFGMTRLEATYHRLGLDRLRPYNQATSPGADVSPTATEAERDAARRRDQLFLETAAGLAQRYALRHVDVRKQLYSRPTDPAEVERSLASSAPSAEHPQFLTLSNDRLGQPDGATHEVEVERRQVSADGRRVIYDIRDPNNKSTLERLVYDVRTHTFEPYSGKSGTYTTIRHDTSELPDQNRKWLEALARGLAQPAERRYIPRWQDDKALPLPPEQYEKEVKGARGTHAIEPPVPTGALNRKVSATQATEVGGVRLFFDPAILETDADDVRWQMVRALTERLAGGNDSFVAGETGTETLAAVSLRAALREAPSVARPTVGGLTRIAGYARSRTTGDVLILGKREPGQSPISLDVLTVALRTVWRRGLLPAISLDPNPANVYGPQKVRYVDLPQEDRDTEFARLMLDADYAMKRIMLGEDRLEIPGYRSSYDLLAAHPGGRLADYVRYWLHPQSTAGADVYVAATPAGDLCRFDSDVKLLTESMRQVEGGMVGTGTADPQEEYATQLFTRFYPQIEERRPIFHLLHGLFDAAKLAAVLRLQGVRDTVLDAAAARGVAHVPQQVSYAGIGPRQVIGTNGTPTTWFVGGGVQSEAKTLPVDRANVPELVRNAELSELLRGSRSELSVTLPAVVPLANDRATSAAALLEARRAAEEALAGQTDTALARVDRALAMAPHAVAPRAVRAFLRQINGDYRGALSDADAVVPALPLFRAPRAGIRLLLGDEAGALADAAAAVAAQPNEAYPLWQKTFVEIQCRLWADADRDLARLTALDPLDARLDGLRSDLRLLRRLGPTKASEYVRLQRALPMWVVMGFGKSGELAQNGRLEESLSLLEALLARIRMLPAARRASLEDRTEAVLAQRLLDSEQPGHHERGLAHLDSLLRRHPRWPILRLSRTVYDRSLPLHEQLRRFERDVILPTAGDMTEMEALGRGGVSGKALLGFALVEKVMNHQGGKDGIDPATAISFFDRLAPYFPAGPGAYYLQTARQVARRATLESRIGKDPAARAEADKLESALRLVPLTLPDRPPYGDALSLSAIQTLFRLSRHTYLQPSGSEYAQRGRYLARLTRLLEVDWYTTALRTTAATLLLEFHESFATAWAQDVRADTNFDPLRQSLARTDDLAGIVPLLDAAAETAASRVGTASTFSRTLLKLELREKYPQILVDRFAGADVGRATLEPELALVRELAAAAASPVQKEAVSDWSQYFITEVYRRIRDPETAARRASELQALRVRLRLAGGGTAQR